LVDRRTKEPYDVKQVCRQCLETGIIDPEIIGNVEEIEKEKRGDRKSLSIL
jgi:hypothetical protein